MSCLHGTHGENGNECDLRIPRHVQPSHEDEGEEPECEIAQRVHGAVHVRDCRDDVDVEAFSVLLRIPEFRDGLALEESDEGEDQTKQHAEEHGRVESPAVDFVRGEAQKE